MAKDAKGHGSEKHATQVARGLAPAAHQYKVQQLDTSLAGQPWRTVAGRGNKTVAERMALGVANDRDRIGIDNSLMRVR